MQKCLSHCAGLGHKVINLTQPGWVISATNVESLLNMRRETNIPKNAKIILDLFGNGTYRWKQEDSTEALPSKLAQVTICLVRSLSAAAQSLQSWVEKASPIFMEMQRNCKLIILPLPRYLFRGCCPYFTHAENITEHGHTEKLLDELIELKIGLITAKKAGFQERLGSSFHPEKKMC
jgi:hypothetical protein